MLSQRPWSGTIDVADVVRVTLAATWWAVPIRNAIGTPGLIDHEAQPQKATAVGDTLGDLISRTVDWFEGCDGLAYLRARASGGLTAAVWSQMPAFEIMMPLDSTIGERCGFAERSDRSPWVSVYERQKRFGSLRGPTSFALYWWDATGDTPNHAAQL